jgi:hypothetical protein
MAYRFMRENQGQYAIREMAGLFGVSSSAYYRWAKYGVADISVAFHVPADRHN